MNHKILYFVFFFNDTATTEIYTLSLHDALPICGDDGAALHPVPGTALDRQLPAADRARTVRRRLRDLLRSEEHTSELQSRQYLVCRLLLEKKRKLINSSA